MRRDNNKLLATYLPSLNFLIVTKESPAAMPYTASTDQEISSMFIFFLYCVFLNIVFFSSLASSLLRMV
jgi:hypothetical protein